MSFWIGKHTVLIRAFVIFLRAIWYVSTGENTLNGAGEADLLWERVRMILFHVTLYCRLRWLDTGIRVGPARYDFYKL